MLYLVPTPIGNLEDMSPRSIRILSEVDLVLSEDTRVSANLFRHFGIQTKLQSFHLNNEHSQTKKWIEALENGQNIALISDAGTPGISDPGYLLVHECREKQIDVQCLPGATAFVPALVASGLSCEKFFFQGFLPQKKGRQTQIKFLAQLPVTFVLYESPHRIIKCMDELILHCGEERQSCVSREISKKFESHYYGNLAEVKQALLNENKVQGEFVVCVAGIKQTHHD